MRRWTLVVLFTLTAMAAIAAAPVAFSVQDEDGKTIINLADDIKIISVISEVEAGCIYRKADSQFHFWGWIPLIGGVKYCENDWQQIKEQYQADKIIPVFHRAVRFVYKDSTGEEKVYVYHRRDFEYTILGRHKGEGEIITRDYDVVMAACKARSRGTLGDMPPIRVRHVQPEKEIYFSTPAGKFLVR